MNSGRTFAGLAAVSSLMLASLACAPATPPRAAPTPPSAHAPAKYRSVHIDTLAPDKVAQFIGARRVWVDDLRRAHTTDGRGLFVQAGPRFYTLRPFADFASFDARGDAVERATARVPAAAAEAYDEGSDTALVFPHTSEIWEVADDLAYAPASGALTEATAACGRMIIEDVRPDPATSKRYRDVTAEIHRALAQARYPLTRVTFRTRYGAGHLVSLWLARSPEELAAAPEVEAALPPARAADLVRERDAAIEHRDVVPIVVRHDLSSAPIP